MSDDTPRRRGTTDGLDEALDLSPGRFLHAIYALFYNKAFGLVLILLTGLLSLIGVLLPQKRPHKPLLLLRPLPPLLHLHLLPQQHLRLRLNLLLLHLLLLTKRHSPKHTPVLQHANWHANWAWIWVRLKALVKKAVLLRKTLNHSLKACCNPAQALLWAAV